MAKRNRITSAMSQTIAESSPLIKASPKFQIPSDKNQIEEINLSKLISNPFQPRIEMNAQPLNDLISSIEKNGLLQPIVVTKNGDDYIIVAGHRRAEAFKIMNKTTIPANILKDTTHKELAILALTENLIRENLHPIENAIAMKHILEQGVVESQNKLAEYLGLSKGHVSKMMNILQLSDSLIRIIKQENYRDINVLVLLNKIDDEDLSVEAFHQIKNLTRSAAEKYLNIHYLKTAKSIAHKNRYNIKSSKSKLHIEIDIKDLDPQILEQVKMHLEKISNNLINT